MPLSDTQIRALKPKETAYKVSDFEGLYITVTPTVSRLWHMKYRINGREKRLSFGAYPSVSLAQARGLKDEARAILARGEDPGESKRILKQETKERQSLTFAAQSKAFIEKVLIEGRAVSTMSKTEWLLDMACSEFGNRPISEITAPMILKCLRTVEAKGNYETAKRLRSKIGAVFRYAIANGAAENDPTYALKDALIRPKPKSRAAIVEPEALGGFMRSIEAFEGQRTTVVALKLLAILAQRPGEIRHARWEEIDLEERVWVIPAERMKMRRVHMVPLPKPAVELMEGLRALTGASPYLFPSLRSLQRPISENTLNGALRRMGYSSDEVTAHGFRASFSTLANESGLWHPDAIERQLAHIEANAVRRAYLRGEHWDERVRMMEWWAGYLDDLRAG